MPRAGVLSVLRPPARSSPLKTGRALLRNRCPSQAQAMTAGGMLEGKEAKFVSGDFGSLHKEEVRKARMPRALEPHRFPGGARPLARLSLCSLRRGSPGSLIAPLPRDPSLPAAPRGGAVRCHHFQPPVPRRGQVRGLMLLAPPGVAPPPAPAQRPRAGCSP